MERIQQALEKAHQNRLKDPSNSFRTNAFDTITPFESVDHIVYQETKTVKVTAETLLANRVIAGLKNDPRSDIFRILRTKVLQRMRASNASVLAVTGPTTGVGKSLVAVNLAVSIAMDANYSVLLIDLDLRKPSVHKFFGISSNTGLGDYIEGNKQIPELLVNPGIEKLIILPVGKPAMNSSELLSTPKMLALVSEIKHRYPNRIIVIDLPPLLPTDDAIAFIPNVDACLLVAAEGENTRDEIERSIQLIDPTKFLGVILNKSFDGRVPEYL